MTREEMIKRVQGYLASFENGYQFANRKAIEA